jgi:hypothetical protein
MGQAWDVLQSALGRTAGVDVGLNLLTRPISSDELNLRLMVSALCTKERPSPFSPIKLLRMYLYQLS